MNFDKLTSWAAFLSCGIGTFIFLNTQNIQFTTTDTATVLFGLTLFFYHEIRFLSVGEQNE
jgi:hypothetical protein